MTKLLSFQAIAQAYDLIPELRKAEVLLAAPDCGLTGVGPYRDSEIIATVLPAYRQALEERRDRLRDVLTNLGVDPDGGETGGAGSFSINPLDLNIQV